MRKESPLIIVMDNDKLVGLCLYWPTASHPQPNAFETEIVRIFNEYKELQVENEQLKEELEKHRWIPVEEGLPEKTGEYLVLPHIKKCSVLCYQNGWFWYDHKDDAILESIGYCEEPIPEITHWKPIEKTLD